MIRHPRGPAYDAAVGGHRGDVERFEAWAPRYDRSPLQPVFFRPVHRALVGALSPAGGQRVLEVGSGTGNLALRLAAAGATVTGIDPAPAMVSRAIAKAAHRGTTPPPRFLVAEAERLPFGDRSFDASATSVSAHHWDEPLAGLREIHRVLAPGGRLALADMRRLGFVRVRLQRRREPGHFEGWAVDELAGLLREASFERVRRRRIWWLDHFVVILAAERATSEP